MPRRYGWKTTQYNPDVLDESESDVSSRDPAPIVLGKSSTWAMYDGDGVWYCSGLIWGDFDGFEPLDDWGYGGLGCTHIKIDGEWL